MIQHSYTHSEQDVSTNNDENSKAYLAFVVALTATVLKAVCIASGNSEVMQRKVLVIVEVISAYREESMMKKQEQGT